MPPCREHLDRLRRQVDVNAADVHRLTDDLDAAALRARPAADRWGVGDCLEHLVATADAYHPRVRAAIAAAPAERDGAALEARPWRPTWFGGWFVRAAGPGGRPIRARGPFVPPPTRPDVVARFAARQGELAALVDAARVVDLRTPRVPSPLSRLLVLRLGEALEMLVVHQQRHLQQAWRAHVALGARDGARHAARTS